MVADRPLTSNLNQTEIGEIVSINFGVRKCRRNEFDLLTRCSSAKCELGGKPTQARRIFSIAAR